MQIRFTPEERVSSSSWIGGSVGLRAGLDFTEKRKIPLLLKDIETRFLGRPAGSPLLRQKSYPN
jgi:hypothetical protein